MFERAFALLVLLFPRACALVEDGLEAFVDDDLVLFLANASEARVGFESGKAGVRHGGDCRVALEPIRVCTAEYLPAPVDA